MIAITEHWRRVLTLDQTSTPLSPSGYGGTGLSPALAFLELAHIYVFPSNACRSRFARIGAPPGAGTIALVTGPVVIFQQPS